MSAGVIEIETAGEQGSVRVLTLNRPERLNALNHELVSQLHDTLDDLRHDRRCRAVVLTGAGRAFCAGLDLKGYDRPAVDGDSPLVATMDTQESIAGLIVKISELPKPVVAAVNGAATGGGLALTLACDTRLSGPTARFNAAFVRVGLSGCDVGVSWLLPKIIGPTAAFEMMLSGRIIDAAEAEQLRLTLRTVPAGMEVREAVAIADSFAANSPIGVRLTKQTMWANLAAPTLRTAVELENRTQVLTTTTQDQREAVRAFLERRPPEFRNA